MKGSMVKRTLLLIFLALPCAGLGQATPTATVQTYSSGLNLPPLNGSFQYGLSTSEIVGRGYSSSGGIYEQTSISGEAAYTAKSEVRPFNLLYTGGVQLGGQSGYSNTAFQSLAVSQGFVTRSWIFGLSDVVSYLPQSPTVGLSGIPGTGDIGFTPIQNGNNPSQNILSVGNSRVSNSVNGTIQRQLDAFTSISGGASHGILRFLGNGGLDSTQIVADIAVSRRIDARTSASVSATYGTFNYTNLGDGASFATRGLSASFQRRLSRSLDVNVSGGPEWISSSSRLGIPSRLTFSAGAGLTYTVRVYSAGLTYSRGVNAGSGLQPGGISDSAVAFLQRPFGNTWSTSANLGYARSRGLSNQQTPASFVLLGLTNSGNYDSTYAGLQISRRISRSFSAFTSYTAMDQSYSQLPVSPTALNGLVQSFAIGISYFPHSIHLGQL